MKKSFFPLLALFLPCAAHADRITQMNQTDLCIYVAKLQVAGYYYFDQGKPRAEVPIHWHGDETENEIEFVNKTLDDAYAWLTRAKENSSGRSLSGQSFGDLVYEACMNGKPL
jgi:hypothetical protein